MYIQKQLVLGRVILYCQYVNACFSKTIVYSSANACPPAQMQNLAREMEHFVLGSLELTYTYPTGIGYLIGTKRLIKSAL